MDSSNLLNLNLANLALFNTNKSQIYPGPPGLEGPTGDTGSTGPPGINGTIGIDGLPGSTGYTGTPGYATNTGATGSSGIPGMNGMNGIQGVTGPTGMRGPSGGLTGDKGPTGDPGPSGFGASSVKYGVISIPSGIFNYNFTQAISTLPESFGTFNTGSITDGITFNPIKRNCTLSGDFAFKNIFNPSRIIETSC
jgi:hypothetical protein